MTKRRLSRMGIEAVVAAAALALAACGAEPYPTPAPQAAPPPPPVADLAGAPEAPPPPPPEAPIPSEAPAPGVAPPPVVIAMAPIPNPPEHRHEARRHHPRHGRRVHRRIAAAPAYRREAPSRRAIPQPHPAVPARHAPLAHPVAKPAPHAAVVPAPHAAAPAAKSAPAKKTVPALKPAAKIAPAAKAVTPAAKPAPAPALSTAAPAVNATGVAGSESPLSDRATRLATLEGVLADALRKGAVLKIPADLMPGKPADVALTVPADFDATVRDQAGKNNLSDAAASVNLTAALSGDGYTVTPDAVQSQPLTAGQPTEFHWTVTVQDGAKGPLHAEVGADLLGAGSDVLSLGSVQSGSGFGLGMLKSNRLLGLGILIVLAVMILAWLARGGRARPMRPAAARREEARRAAARRRAAADPGAIMLGDKEI